MWNMLSTLTGMRCRLLLAAGLCVIVSHQNVHAARGVMQSQLSRLNPSTESTSVLLETSKELLKNDQLEDALPFLSEILIRLEGDEEKKARQTKAFTLYQLAHCQMKLGDYEVAGANSAQFCDEYPDDPQMESARVLAAQSLTMVQKWPEAEVQAELVLENLRLADDTLTSITMPLVPEGAFSEVSRTSAAFSPKMARNRRSSGASSVSLFGVILPTRISPGLTSAPTWMIPS